VWCILKLGKESGEFMWGRDKGGTLIEEMKSYPGEIGFMKGVMKRYCVFGK
jgi:hypothetical protein